MIKSLSLKNFKAFKDSCDITFSPITLISGQNSSGKSSIIQSILIFKQTIESPLTEESLQLNGNYIALGEMSDIIHNLESELEFSFSFKNNDYNELIDSLVFDEDDILNVEISLKYNKPDNFNYSKSLSDIAFKIESSEQVKTLDIKCGNEIEQILLKEFIPPLEELDSKNIHLLGASSEFIDSKEIALAFNGFLPSYILYMLNIQAQNITTKAINSIMEIISEDLDLPFSSKRNRLMFHNLIRRLDIPSKNQIDENDLDILKKLFEPFIPHYSRNNYDIEKLIIATGKVSKEAFNKITLKLNYYMEDLIKANKNKSHLILKNLYDAEDDGLYGQLDETVKLIKDNFNSVYYLGPLREQPKSFYGNYTTQNNLYVGAKGEHVAFILKYYSNKKVKTILPPSDHNEFNFKNADIIEISLGEALSKWLNYLGVAREVSVGNVSKVGLTLKANINGGVSSDLTNVGVGVSQILPLLVLGLISPNESILVFEQPELHLHPYVQSRLADFFISLSKTNKQVIAETHSEHLLNRMRLHLAKDQLSYEKDLSVYFCKYNDEGTSSEIVKIFYDKYGSAENYPLGFFDETEKQLQEILYAAISREI